MCWLATDNIENLMHFWPNVCVFRGTEGVNAHIPGEQVNVFRNVTLRTAQSFVVSMQTHKHFARAYVCSRRECEIACVFITPHRVVSIFFSIAIVMPRMDAFLSVCMNCGVVRWHAQPTQADTHSPFGVRDGRCSLKLCRRRHRCRPTPRTHPLLPTSHSSQQTIRTSICYLLCCVLCANTLPRQLSCGSGSVQRCSRWRMYYVMCANYVLLYMCVFCADASECFVRHLQFHTQVACVARTRTPSRAHTRSRYNSSLSSTSASSGFIKVFRLRQDARRRAETGDEARRRKMWFLSSSGFLAALSHAVAAASPLMLVGGGRACKGIVFFVECELIWVKRCQSRVRSEGEPVRAYAAYFPSTSLSPSMRVHM